MLYLLTTYDASQTGAEADDDGDDDHDDDGDDDDDDDGDGDGDDDDDDDGGDDDDEVLIIFSLSHHIISPLPPAPHPLLLPRGSAASG